MTFLRQIQRVLERTYASTGVNFEEFLVGHSRCAELSARSNPEICEFSGEGITFFYVADGRLRIAIYYHPSIITRLERNHPFSTLSEENIRALIVFIEELSHAVHAAISFLEKNFDPDSEATLCNLELQAKLDTYLALKLITGMILGVKRLPKRYRLWLLFWVFQRDFQNYQEARLWRRYVETGHLGLRLAQHLDTLGSEERVRFIQQFRPLPYSVKKALIRAIKDSPV